MSQQEESKVETEEGENVASAAMALRECMATVYAAQQQIWPYMKADNLWMVDSLVDHYGKAGLRSIQSTVSIWRRWTRKLLLHCSPSGRSAVLTARSWHCWSGQSWQGSAANYLSAEQVDSHLSQADWSGSPLEWRSQ